MQELLQELQAAQAACKESHELLQEEKRRYHMLQKTLRKELTLGLDEEAVDAAAGTRRASSAFMATM